MIVDLLWLISAYGLYRLFCLSSLFDPYTLPLVPV